MNRTFASLFLFCATFLVALHSASAVTIDWVSVGNAGNANDPAWGSAYGGVAYNYSIDKYDVTVGQYTDFLNSVAATDTYGLYNTSMGTDANIEGISRTGSSGSYSYSVIGNTANFPITYVSWGDAARFANWLQNGQPGLGGPSVPENAASTEDGGYTLNGATSQAALNAITRNADATIFIPSESEWYKAAYYDPTLNSGAGGYYGNPFSTNTPATSAPPGSTPNTANFRGSDYAVAGPPYLTNVGAYTASASPYGVYDMGGNVWQWNEALISGSSRGLRGGSWGDYGYGQASSDRDEVYPTAETAGIGFRVASVPEPSTAVLAIMACGLMWVLRKRFK